MNFINPILLLFAAAASVPLLLHLFSRQRVKVVEFSTIKYLLALQKTRMRKLKIRQILLLILRTLILLVVAFAFARPTIEGGYLPALGGKTSTTAIIMIDISASSSSETNLGSFFEKGIEKALQILDSFTEKEKVVILGFASDVIYDSGKPSSDFEHHRQMLLKMKPLSSKANPTLAFSRAFQIFKESSDPNLEIYLVSDLQGEAYRDFEFTLLETEQIDAKLFVVPTATEGRDNVSLAGIRFPNQIITAGREFTLLVDIVNHKEELSTDLLVSLELGDAKVAQTDISIPPAGSGTVSFSQTASSTGFLYGTISIDDDDLMKDNRYHFGVRIPSLTKVVIICDNEQESFHLQKALAPVENEDLFKRVDVVPPAQVGSINLFDYNVVIVDLKGSLPSPLLSSLKTYLNAGGAVLFLTSPSVDVRDFSSKFTSPVFGLQLLESPSPPVPEAGKYLLNKFDYDHPLFAPYQKFDAQQQPQVEFYGHHKLLESARATVLARFSDNSPAVAETKLGKGRAILYLFNLDERYSDVIYHPLMVIMLNRSVEYLVSEPLNQREELIAGQEVIRSLAAQSARQFSLVDPGSDTTQLSPVLKGGEVIFHLGTLNQTGIYRILGDRIPVDLFAINFPQSESELNYLDPQQLGEKVAGVRVSVLDDSVDPAEMIASARFGKELWKLFLLLGFVFLLMEMAVASGGKQTEVNRS